MSVIFHPGLVYCSSLFFYFLNGILKEIVNFVTQNCYAAELKSNQVSIAPVISHRHFCNIKIMSFSI